LLPVIDHWGSERRTGRGTSLLLRVRNSAEDNGRCALKARLFDPRSAKRPTSVFENQQPMLDRK
jgi:hypothetical protein